MEKHTIFRHTPANHGLPTRSATVSGPGIERAGFNVPARHRKSLGRFPGCSARRQCRYQSVGGCSRPPSFDAINTPKPVADLAAVTGQQRFQLGHTGTAVGAGFQGRTDLFGTGEVPGLYGVDNGVDAHAEAGADDAAAVPLAFGGFARQQAAAGVVVEPVLLEQLCQPVA
jgi:hypothetical protein